MNRSKNKTAEPHVCGARLDWARRGARLALPRLLSARVINLLTGLYQGARGKYASARLGPRLCQGYKQPVICVPNRVICALSAPKHMGHTEQR